MRKLALIILILSLARYCYGQINPGDEKTEQAISRNSVYLEAFGNGIMYSVNYDRIIIITERSLLIARAGGSYYFDNNSNIEGFIIPLELTTLRRKKKKHLEYGFGVVFLLISDDGNKDEYFIIGSSLRLGYRFQKPEGGLLIRIGFTPVIPIAVVNDPSAEFNPNIAPWGGISIGYTFKKRKINP